MCEEFSAVWQHVDLEGGSTDRRMIRFELPKRSTRGNIRRIPTDVSGSRNVCVLMGAQREAAAPSRKCCAGLGIQMDFYGEVDLARCAAVVTQQATGNMQPNKRGRHSAEICPETGLTAHDAHGSGPAAFFIPSLQ